MQSPRDTRLDEGIVVRIGRVGSERGEGGGGTLEVREKVGDPSDPETRETVAERRVPRGARRARGTSTRSGCGRRRGAGRRGSRACSRRPAGCRERRARSSRSRASSDFESIGKPLIQSAKQPASVQAGAHEAEEFLGEQVRGADPPGMARLRRDHVVARPGSRSPRAPGDAGRRRASAARADPRAGSRARDRAWPGPRRPSARARPRRSSAARVSSSTRSVLPPPRPITRARCRRLGK